VTSFDASDTFSSETVDAAREWLLDADWIIGMDTEYRIRRMPATRIMQAIERNYDGGIAGFVEDAS